MEVVEKACSIKETEEGMYSYVSDDDLEEDNQNIISVSQVKSELTNTKKMK